MQSEIIINTSHTILGKDYNDNMDWSSKREGRKLYSKEHKHVEVIKYDCKVKEL